MTEPLPVHDRRSRIPHIVLWGRRFLFLNVVVGTTIVALGAGAQERRGGLSRDDAAIAAAREVQAMVDRQVSLDGRLKLLEELKIAERLALLDDVHADARQTKYLAFGAMFILGGGLLLDWKDPNRRRNRRGE